VPHVTVRGLAFHVVELGEPRASPLVMLHGLLVGNLASWYFTAAPALARAHRVLLYDLRGHGKSDRPAGGYDVASMSEDLGAIAAGFDDRPLDLVGHSFGALVALRFALDRPERVRRLAIVEAPLPPSRFEELAELRAQTPAEMVAALPDDLKAAIVGGGRRAARLVASLAALTGGTSILADLSAEPDIPDDALGRLACPTLCVYGDRSRCLPVGERIARAIPGARLLVLPGGHYLHLDAGPALAGALVEHFDG
jgi:pimeloyl-ACP methyl ester carboxylesterase